MLAHVGSRAALPGERRLKHVQSFRIQVCLCIRLYSKVSTMQQRESKLLLDLIQEIKLSLAGYKKVHVQNRALCVLQNSTVLHQAVKTRACSLYVRDKSRENGTERLRGSSFARSCGC